MKRRSVAEEIIANLNWLLASEGSVEIQWRRTWNERAYEVSVFDAKPNGSHTHHNGSTLAEALARAASQQAGKKP